MGLKLEFYDVADLPSLDRLWENNTDWGEQSQALRRWFMEAPFGKPSVVVATDAETGKAVGQFRFMPARVWVNGREVSAVRPFGTIVTKEAHEAAAAQRPLDNPIWAMLFRGIDEFRVRGARLVYIVPDERWVGFLKRATDTVLKVANMKLGSFPLWSMPLPLAGGLLPLGEGFTASPLENWDGVDGLWEASRKLHNCMVVRDASVLRWKLAQAAFTVTTIKRDGELVGLVATREKGDRQLLICDLLAADDGPALRAILAAAVNVSHEEATARAGANELRKVGVLATSVMEPAIRELGFVRDAYDFPLLVQSLDKSLSVDDDVKPERWYFSAND